jgi:hypothetical protein
LASVNVIRNWTWPRLLGGIGRPGRHDQAFGQASSLDRQFGYPARLGENVGRRLRTARVALLGVDAVGAGLARYLVGAGVGELWLIDGDKVTPPDLNRQSLASRRDAGGSKTQAAGRALHRQDPAVRVHPIDLEITEPGQLAAVPGSVDLLLVAIDASPELGHVIWQWARPHDVAVCFAAVGLGSGYWGPLLKPGRGHCWPCFEKGWRAKLAADARTTRTISTAPLPRSFGPADATVSALCGNEAVQYLATGDCALINGRWQIRLADNSTSFLAGPQACHCQSMASR